MHAPHNLWKPRVYHTMDQTWRFIHIISFMKLMRMVVIWNTFVQETLFTKIYQKCSAILNRKLHSRKSMKNFESFYTGNFIWKMSHLVHHLLQRWNFIHKSWWTIMDDGPDWTHFHEWSFIHENEIICHSYHFSWMKLYV